MTCFFRLVLCFVLVRVREMSVRGHHCRSHTLSQCRCTCPLHQPQTRLSCLEIVCHICRCIAGALAIWKNNARTAKRRASNGPRASEKRRGLSIGCRRLFIIITTAHCAPPPGGNDQDCLTTWKNMSSLSSFPHSRTELSPFTMR